MPISVRFLHTSDWHMGLRAVQTAGKARAVRAKRFETASMIAELAKREKVDFVLVAGDLFDSHDVDDGVVRSTVDILNSFAPMPVFVIPGNHDPLLAGGVWDRPTWQAAGSHVELVRAAEEIRYGDTVVLYPCPITQKLSRTDPTGWIPCRDAGDKRIRIGFAHGFLNILPGDGNFPIDGDRSEKSGLDYLALGDWHGSVIRGRAVYPGTPEQTNYDEKDPGNVIIAEVGAACEAPVITKTRVGSLTWREYRRPIADDTDVNSLRSAIRSDGPLSLQLLRIISAPDSNISREGLSALQSLREELLDGAFHLDWPEESMDIPVRDDAVLPEGLLSYIDADIQSLSEGKLPPGIQPGVLNIDNAVMTEARALLRRLHREGDA